MYLPAGSCDAAEEVACPTPESGLVVRTHGGDVVPIHSRPDQLLFQSGRTLQLLSGGIIKATQHAVLAPKHAQHGVTRNTFAVFCQPKCATKDTKYGTFGMYDNIIAVSTKTFTPPSMFM